MLNIIFYDIETISIFTKEEREQPTFLRLKDKYGDNLNFMPEFNKIFCVSIGKIDKEGNIQTHTYSGDEKDIIENFFKYSSCTQCGYNIKGFDMPFITKRALFHKIKIPEPLKTFGKTPRAMKNILDLYEVYKCGGFGNRLGGSLDLVCNFLGITSPKDQGIDGSMVQTYFDNGKGKEIIEYCERDVAATIEVWNYFKEYNMI